MALYDVFFFLLILQINQQKASEMVKSYFDHLSARSTVYLYRFRYSYRLALLTLPVILEWEGLFYPL